MNVKAVWSFIAGDSIRTPLGVAVAIAVVFILQRRLPAAAAGWSGALFVALIVASLVAGVFERPRS